jgi:glycine/D-amino acid oxidase-like deaminating enzyme
MGSTEFAVLGGGLVGMAVAYGLARQGRQVTVFDEGDLAYRASRGNFGLIWVQGKGSAMPAYAAWTRHSAALWPLFAEELRERTGIAVELSQPGGFDFFLDDDEAEAGVARLNGLRDALGGDYPFEYLGHNALKEVVPHIGPDVVGATFHHEDGHVNPLYLLRALHHGFRELGGQVVAGQSIERLEHLDPGFRIHAAQAWQAEQVALCAGLGNAALAPQVGLEAPVRPQRGQVIVCERVKPFMHHPSMRIRQVGEGAVQLGDSKEEVGMDDGTTPEVLAGIVRRAVRTFPLLRHVRIVRAWGALRVMSPDGHPIYDASTRCPGAFLVTCHSGVTLAAAHALELARWLTRGQSPQPMEDFSVARFHVQAPG